MKDIQLLQCAIRRCGINAEMAYNRKTIEDNLYYKESLREIIRLANEEFRRVKKLLGE